MEPINNNLTLQRIGAWGIEELQKSFNIASTERRRIDSDDHRFWARSGDGLKVLPDGEQSDRRTKAPIEITFIWEREVMVIWVDDIYTLIDVERLTHFDPRDIPSLPMGEIEMEVSMGDALERLPIWESLPPNPQGNAINRPPKVVRNV